MWPPSQWPCWTLTDLYVLFLHFLVRNHQYFLVWASTLDPECITTTPIFFWFFPYFIPVFHLEMKMFPYLEMPIGPWKQCLPSIIINPSLFFFSDFFCILLPFFIQKSIFSIFGSVHWTLKQYPSITSDDNHPYLFCDFFAILLTFFIQHTHTFQIWKSVLDPENNAQYGHQPSSIFFLHFFLIFSLFYCYFFFSIATLSIFGNGCWTLNAMPNMVTNHPPIFSDFFAIFLLFYIQNSHTFHEGDYCHACCLKVYFHMYYQEILPVASPCIVHQGGILFRQMLIMILICVVVQAFLIYMPTHKVAELLSKVSIPNLTIQM